jgi:AraC family transcriptional regulator
MIRTLGPGDFYGNRQRSFVIPSARFTEMAYVPSFKIPPHAHERAFFGLILEGAYTERYERKSRDCGSSTVLFHPEGESHSEDHHDVVVRIFSVEPDPELLTRIRTRSSALHGPLESPGGSMTQLCGRLYREFRNPDPLSPIAMEGLVLELLTEAGRHSISPPEAHHPRWLREARDLLHDRFTEDLSLQEIAVTVGIHPTHLARTFRRCYGCTVGDYLRQLRIRQASHALATSNESLCQIALDAGYSDQSHFASAFKREIGLTPGQYRKTTQDR